MRYGTCQTNRRTRERIFFAAGILSLALWLFMAAAELCTPLHAWLHGGTITGTPFSVSSGIGFLALFGVSVQMAVVYISYVNELRLNGTNLTEAVREGAILRLRPIMMTALVAALGLLPAALATGVGTDTQRPFALVIVSGLFTRLLISIFLMPVLYTLVAFGRPAGSVMSHLHLAKNPRREVRC